MATAREHMLSDMAHTYAQDGEGVGESVIDGQTVRLLSPPVEEIPTEMENLIVVRKKIYHLTEDLARKIPGQEVVVDGVDWTVVSHFAGPLLVCLTLERMYS